jgi:hypothetical protein
MNSDLGVWTSSELDVRLLAKTAKAFDGMRPN